MAASVPVARDEIAEFQDLKSMGSSEACWMTYGFTLFNNRPGVKRLSVHLKDSHTIQIEDGRCEEALAKQTNTELTQWFELNKHGPRQSS